MKNLTAVLLAVMLLFTTMPWAASAATLDEVAQPVGASSGTTGDCTWTLDDEGTLTISGNGAMQNYSFKNSGGTYITTAPWGTNIKTVVIEVGVTSIGDYAFYGCTDLTNIIGANGVTSVAYDAFTNCPAAIGITGDCRWNRNGNGVLTISGNGAMANYSSGSSSPWGRNITSVIIENGVTSIGDYAFYNCIRLTNVTIGNGVTSIGNYAFSGCTVLTSVTIPDSVTSIGGYAFSGFTGLTSVTIPDSVTSIGSSAFRGCTGLTIYCLADSFAERYAKNNSILTCVLPYHYEKLIDGTVEISLYTGNEKNVTIPDSIFGKPVSTVKKWAFANNTIMESVVIPDTVTSIAKGTFYNCTELKTVTMGNNVTAIGESAFEKCLFLEEINLSSKLKTIGDEAFYDCRRLKKLTLPNTVTAIGEEAFTNCRSLQNLVIPNGVQTLGNDSSVGFGMFENCKSLQEITIPASVGAIQSNAFDGCNGVTIVGEPNSYAQQYAANQNILFRAIATESVGDADRDGHISISDVTMVQRYIAELVQFDDATRALADTNGDGIVNIDDATHLQRYLAEYDVVLGGKN